MSPAAYSLGATPPLSRTERSFRPSFTTSSTSSTRVPSSPYSTHGQHRTSEDSNRGLHSAFEDQISPVKQGFFRRLAGGGGGGGGIGRKHKEVVGAGAGEGGDGRIPWDTESAPSVPYGGRRSPPSSPTKARRPPFHSPSHPPYSPTSFPPDSPTVSTSSSRRDRYGRDDRGQGHGHHARSSSGASSSGGYSMLFASGMQNLKQQGQSQEIDEEGGGGGGSDGEGGRGGGGGGSRFGSAGKKSGGTAGSGSGSGSLGVRSLAKKRSKFSLRSLVYAHGSGGGTDGRRERSGSNNSDTLDTGAGADPQTQSLPLPSTSRFPSASASFDFPRSRRPSIPLLDEPSRSAQPYSNTFPRDISISAPHVPRKTPQTAGGAFLTPLPSPKMRERERKGSAMSALSGWGAGGGGKEDTVKGEGGKGSVRGKAARLLGEEIVPSGKAARLLGMERKKTLKKKSSNISLSAESAYTDFDRRPSIATTYTATTHSYESPPSSFPPTPSMEQQLHQPLPSSRFTRRRSSSDPSTLFSQLPSLTSSAWPSPERGHRSLAERGSDYDDDGYDELWAPPSPPGSPSTHPLDATHRFNYLTSPPPTSDYEGSSPRCDSRDSTFSSGSVSVSGGGGGYGRPSLRRSVSGSPERVLSYASSSYGIPSTYYPFNVTPPLSSPTSMAPTTPGLWIDGGFSLAAASSSVAGAASSPALSRHPHRLSPDSIRFSTLGLSMGSEGFISSPSNDSPRSNSPASAWTSKRVSSVASFRVGPVPPTRPSLGMRSYSASSIVSPSSTISASRRPWTPGGASISSKSASASVSPSPLPPNGLPSLPLPPLPPPPPPPPPSSRPRRSDTLISVASVHTRLQQRSTTLDALEGKSSPASSPVRSVAQASSSTVVGEERGSRKKALQARGLRSLAEEERARGSGSSGSRSSSRETGEEEKERWRREKKQAAKVVRESRPFLDFEWSSSDEGENGDEEEGDEDANPRQSVVAPSSTTSRLPPPRSPLPTLPPHSSPSLSSALSPPPPPFASLPLPPPPPPSTALPPPPPPSSALPALPFALLPQHHPIPFPRPWRQHHTRTATVSSTTSVVSDVSTSPSDGGMSEYSTFSATASAFPVPPTVLAAGGGVGGPAVGRTLPKYSPPVLEQEGGGYRFPPPRSSSRQALSELGGA